MSNLGENADLERSVIKNDNLDGEAAKMSNDTCLEKTSLSPFYRFTLAEQKSIIRRIDYRLVLTLGALYCVSLMDRTNLGFAAIAG